MFFRSGDGRSAPSVFCRSSRVFRLAYSADWQAAFDDSSPISAEGNRLRFQRRIFQISQENWGNSLRNINRFPSVEIGVK